MYLKSYHGINKKKKRETREYKEARKPNTLMPIPFLGQAWCIVLWGEEWADTLTTVVMGDYIMGS